MDNNLNLTPPPRAVYLLCTRTNRVFVGTLRPSSLLFSLPVLSPIDHDHGVQGLPRPPGVRVLHLSTISDKGTPGEQMPLPPLFRGSGSFFVLFFPHSPRVFRCCLESYRPRVLQQLLSSVMERCCIFCNYHPLDKETAVLVLWLCGSRASGPMRRCDTF